MTYPNEPQPRIAPLSTDDLRPEWVRTLERIPGKGLKGEGFPRNVLGVLMKNGDTLGSFLDWWVTCKSRMAFTVREQELVILRMGVLYRSEYVWKHHVAVGREFGVTDPEMQALRDGRYGAIASDRERLVLEITDAFVNERCLPPALWARARVALSEQEIVDLVSLVSQYVLFALTNVCAQVQVEAAVAGLPGVEG